MDATKGYLLLTHLPALLAAKSVAAFIGELQQLLDYALSQQIASQVLCELLLAAELVKLASRVLAPTKESRLEPVETEHFGKRLAKLSRPCFYLMLLTAFGRRSWLAFLVCAGLDWFSEKREFGIYLLRHPLYYWITKRVAGRIRLVDAVVEGYQRFITNTI